MDLAEVKLAGSEQAQAALAALPPYDVAMALQLGEQLRRRGHEAAFVAAILTQARLRSRVRPRWGPITDRLVLTPDGAEQATRPIVAGYRADRFGASGVTAVADLGCGLGLDAFALARQGLTVVAFDKDPATAAAAAINARALGLADLVDVRCADVLDLTPNQLNDLNDLNDSVNGVFADPARRSNGRRLNRPEDWSPPLSWVLDLPFEALGIKVAPGLDHARIPAGHEFEVVSVNGDVVEAGLYRGPLRTAAAFRATLLPTGATVTDRDLPEESPVIRAIGKYLLEPDGAVIRAGLVATVAESVHGGLIDPRIAYVTTDADIDTAFATRYAVIDVLPFNVRQLRDLLKARNVGRVTIKKRGFAAEPDTIRTKLRLDRQQPAEATIVLTRLGRDPVAIVVEPIATAR